MSAAAAFHHRQRRFLRRNRIFRDRRNPLDVFDDMEMFEKFRFHRENIMTLTEELEPHLIQNGRRGGLLPAILQVCLTLRFFLPQAHSKTQLGR
ncbi:hypothetical protein RRG08_023461 [Elysia crispata]|uniref:Uncharacterized protein n=1 Tax=Elysia crispata TaxID=231223 RepID=A0AAE1AEH5_9GAST|nr:hypothetical protein RRG08_023461 [Elysia crispata]